MPIPIRHLGQSAFVADIILGRLDNDQDYIIFYADSYMFEPVPENDL